MGVRAVIVQHGEKAREPGDPGLTALGRRQAEEVATAVASLYPVAEVWSSPMRRAVETAEPLAAATGLRLQTDDRLRERMNWEGPQVQSLDEFLTEWQQTSLDRAHTPRSGDSSEAAARRFIAAITEIALRLEPDNCLAVVAHGGVTVDCLRTVAGDQFIDDRQPQLWAEGVPCGAVTILDWSGARWKINGLPSTAHLSGSTTHRPA